LSRELIILRKTALDREETNERVNCVFHEPKLSEE
jgi:hypothetical protein